LDLYITIVNGIGACFCC